jgi:uncharacterized membrane protein YgcG
VIERRPPFGIGELPPADEAGDLTGSLALGRELDALGAAPAPPLPADWADGVMAAIAREPAPQPVVVASRALRAGRPKALFLAIVDAWRVAFGAGRPLLVRAPALALVLIAVVLIGSIGTIGGYAGARALGLIPDQAPPVVPLPSPSPSPTPQATQPPSPSPTASPSISPSPSPSSAPPTPSPSASETDELETESPETSDDSGGGGNSGPGSDNSGSGSDGSGSGSGSGRSGSGSDDSDDSSDA